MPAKISLKEVRELSNYYWNLKKNQQDLNIEITNCLYTALYSFNALVIKTSELVKTSRQLESVWITVVNLISSLLQPGKYR